MRLIYLHDKACVDALVEQWPERTIDVKEGSRHRLRVQSATINGWVTVKLRDGTKQLQPPKEAAPDDESNLQVVVSKPVKVNASFDEKSEKAGMLPCRQLVNVIEVRTADDGSVRASVGTVAAEAAIVTAALNEFNHAVQRFATVSEYEAARSNYCEDIVLKKVPCNP